MRTFWKELMVSVFMGGVLPALVFSHGFLIRGVPDEADPIPVIEETKPEILESNIYIKIRQKNGDIKDMELDHYLVGVVLGEMPAYFEEEALKAQAVVARTYTMRIHRNKGKHGDGSICTEPSCCQAYLAPLDYLERGGTGESLAKVKSAVTDTSGEVLCYLGELIEATYFSCSGGVTEDAQAVWGTEYPYLKSVPSPGEENASVYEDTASFSFEAFRERLGVELKGEPLAWFGSVTYTAGGGVATMEIGREEYTGTELRSLLGLRSTAFSVEVTQDALVFHTKGYGHRVGMSQYGAEAMAVNGSTYDAILAHYYQGTELVRLDNQIDRQKPLINLTADDKIYIE